MTSDDIYTVIISLILVFAVLAGICAFVYVISVLIRSLSRNKKVQVVDSDICETVTVPQEQASAPDSYCAQGDDSAVVAAIIAAITAYRRAKYGTQTKNFRVVSFRRTGAGR